MRKLLLFVFLILSKLSFGQPANDNCSTPQIIVIPSSGSICVNSTNVSATTDLTTFSCQTSNDNDVWFAYTATGSQNTITVTPNGATPAQQVAVSISNSNCASGAYNVCNASASNGGTATATWTYALGAQVLINVATNGASGTFQVCVTSVTPPPSPGSSCATSTSLCNLTNFAINPMPNNSNGFMPPCFFSALQRPVFYRFTAGTSGTCSWVATPTGASEFDWAMYDITTGCPGTVVACNYNFALGVGAPIGLSTASTVTCPTSGAAGNTGEFCQPVGVIAGRTYLIIIDNYYDNNIGFNFSWAGSTFQMAPTAAFTVSPTNACNTALASFINNSVPAGNSYSWNFGDGTTSVATNPPVHNYPTAGTYLISLTATTASGCTSTGSGSVTVNTPPTMIAPANITVCSGTPIPSSAFVSAPTGATFTWTNSNNAIGMALSGAGNVPAFTPTNNTGAPITSTFTVIPSRNGCPGTAVTYTITVNPRPNVTINSPVICAGQTANLIANGATSYTWSAGATPSLPGPNTADATPAVTATYTVTGSALGCTKTAVSTVTVVNNPVITVNSPTICSGTTATLVASGGTAYSWSAGATPLIPNADTANASPATTTTYTVTGFALGCTSTAVAIVTVNNNPIVAVNSPTICEGSIANLTASGATTYTWSAGATPAVLGAATADASPIITSTYTVTGDDLGCIGTATATVTVNAVPTVSVNSLTICNGDIANLIASGATTYSWSAGATETAPGANTADASPSVTTTYTVTGTTNGCSNTDLSTITVNAIPVVLVNSPTICAGATANLLATGAGSYTWSAGVTPTSFTGDAADASPATSSTYTVTGTTSGCSGTSTATVTVNNNPTVTVNSPTICVGDVAQLIAGGATSYTWTAGVTTTSPDGSTADATPLLTTTYTVTGTDVGCFGTAIASVTVNSYPIVSVNSPTICEGQTANLSASGATIYSWSVGATETAPGANTADAAPLVTTTYTVTGTSNGCSTNNVSTVTVNLNPIVAVNSLTICAGSTANMLASGANSYTWSAGVTTTSPNGDAANASPATTTTYTVIGTTAAGCSSPSTVTVTVNNNPIVTINSPTICVGDTAHFVAGGATTYTWTAGVTSTSINGDIAFAVPAITTTYTVTGSSLGCIGFNTATVTVNSYPILNVNSPTICEGDIANLTAGGATSYVWSVGATATAPNANTATASPIATTSYTVTGTSSGCSSTIVSTVTVNPLPVLSVNSAVVCAGQTAALLASGANTYTWSAGVTPGLVGNATATPLISTTYTVTGTTSNCSVNATATVVVNPIPTANVSGGGTACVGNPVPSINIAFAVGGPWTFTYTDGTTNNTITTATTPYIISNPSAGNYSVTAISSANCVGTTTGNPLVAFNPLPTPAFTVNQVSGCAPLCVSFTDGSSPAGTIASWDWSFGDGGAVSSQNPNHCYANAGVYSVTLTATSNDNCPATTTITNLITVNAVPVASFVSPRLTSITSPTVQFEDYSSNATSWNWDFGDASTMSDTSHVQNPSHTYTQVGTYCVLLQVSNGICVDTSMICLVVEPEFSFYIPNAFSPNGDGINDEFFGKGENFKDFEMSIYDRWGSLLFFTDDITKHWNGKGNGGDALQEDIYVYVVNIKDTLKVEHKYIGSISLVR